MKQPLRSLPRRRNVAGRFLCHVEIHASNSQRVMWTKSVKCYKPQLINETVALYYHDSVRRRVEFTTN